MTTRSSQFSDMLKQVERGEIPINVIHNRLFEDWRDNDGIRRHPSVGDLVFENDPENYLEVTIFDIHSGCRLRSLKGEEISCEPSQFWKRFKLL